MAALFWPENAQFLLERQVSPLITLLDPHGIWFDPGSRPIVSKETFGECELFSGVILQGLEYFRQNSGFCPVQGGTKVHSCQVWCRSQRHSRYLTQVNTWPAKSVFGDARRLFVQLPTCHVSINGRETFASGESRTAAISFRQLNCRLIEKRSSILIIFESLVCTRSFAFCSQRVTNEL